MYYWLIPLLLPVLNPTTRDNRSYPCGQSLLAQPSGAHLVRIIPDMNVWGTAVQEYRWEYELPPATPVNHDRHDPQRSCRRAEDGVNRRQPGTGKTVEREEATGHQQHNQQQE